MNIRRIATTFTTGGVISLLAVGALGTGSAQAALCLEAGPDGPRTVPCPIELSAVESAVAGNAAFDRLLDSLADIALPAGPTDGDGQDESPEPEMCELVLADGRVAEIPCRMEPIGDIVFNPNPDTDEPPAEESPTEESPAGEPTTDESPIIPEEGDGVAEEPVASADEPVADESDVDEPVADEPVEDTTADDAAIDEPVADDPVSDEPVSDEPVADEPVEDTTADDAAIDEPVADDPVSDEPVTEDRPLDELATGDDTAAEAVDAPIDSGSDIDTDIAASETAETGEEVVSGGALPRTGATTMGITLGLALMGLGGGTFAKIAAGRRRR
jgi:hypothetical protein